jgi:FGGY-family pentulose kinase
MKNSPPNDKRQPLHFIGIDVGTGSARAGIFTAGGKMLASASQTIQMWKLPGEFVEQSSDDIWKACCTSVRAALRKSGLSGDQIHGIGFDATCSLVALDSKDQPVTVSPSGESRRNVIVWMDHRAVPQADRINRIGHAVLKNVGGIISPEMQTPKLLWLKENLPLSWKRTEHFFDLPDFLTYRATGVPTRSLCSTVCKWTYQSSPEEKKARWDTGYFKKIGLGELAQEGFRRLGTEIRPMGEPIGKGLTAQAAKELGLTPGVPVGVSIIDAHAGGLGLLGASTGGKRLKEGDLEKRLALIGGTSSCHMAVSSKPRFIQGIWGPYYSAMIPGLYLTEGGQSATGALIDEVIFSHSASLPVLKEGEKESKTIYELLNAHLEKMAKGEKVSHPAELTRDLHLQPDFHGNRSPR